MFILLLRHFEYNLTKKFHFANCIVWRFLEPRLTIKWRRQKDMFMYKNGPFGQGFFKGGRADHEVSVSRT